MVRSKKVSLQQACSIIQSGGVVAIPTETVYGLAANIQCASAIKRIFRIKKRPLFDPLIVHFSNKKQLRNLCQYHASIVESLSDYFHPGPLTLVLRKKSAVSSLITAGSNTVAVRIPQHPLTLELIEKTNTCLAAPSANLFSKTSPTRATHILESLNIPVLDGGPCRIGIESTILDIKINKRELNILRPGFIGKADLENFLKSNQFQDWIVSYKNQSSHPGSYSTHYRPDVPFIMIQATHSNCTKELIENKIKRNYPNKIPQELKIKPDPFIFAREMYHQMRQLSKKSNVVGYVIKNNISQKNPEAWLSIWDRLEKATSHTYHID